MMLNPPSLFPVNEKFGTCADQIYVGLKIPHWFLVNAQVVAAYRRKFRNQTPDNMDRWKAGMGRIREEKRREEKVGSTMMQVHDQVETRQTVCRSNDLWLRRVEK